MGSKNRSGILYTNFHCVLLVAVSSFLVVSLEQLTASVSFTYMDSPSREAFLASVVPEEEWLDSVSQRLSAGPVPLGGTTQAPPTPTVPLPTEDQFQSPAASQTDSAAGPVRRSGRKRKSTADHLEARKHKMATPTDQPVLEQLEGDERGERKR